MHIYMYIYITIVKNVTRLFQSGGSVQVIRFVREAVLSFVSGLIAWALLRCCW